MATIYIENRPYYVKDGENLLEACLCLGFDVPYFCWHPALGSVGSCRQCAVKLFRDEKDAKGKIIMSCMTQVKNGMRISIDDHEVVQFRRSVIEWLMLNHPHDCPICDEGGECHLQDMTVMTGHVYRKTRFRKRTYKNQYMGPFVNHEMNRCIQCYRCVRFYNDYAMGRDLNVFSAHDHVYFGRYKDGILESEFSGNLIEICPTGVFTDKPFKKHYTRKWDLQSAPSICVHCSLGCNTLPGERYGSLRRVLNRFNFTVNGYFLCDRGRFGYSFVNSPDRIRRTLMKKADFSSKPVSPEDIQEYFSSSFHFGTPAIGIGSPTASLEANYALRTLVGAESFYLGMSAADYRLVSLITNIMSDWPSVTPSLEDMRNCDAVLVLGEDVTNTAPLADLAARRSACQKPLKKMDEASIPRWNSLAVGYVTQNERGPLFIASLAGTKLDDIATSTYRGTPEDLARFGFAIAHAVHAEAPQAGDISGSEGFLANAIATALKNAERPLIVSGTGCRSEAIIQAAANIALALSTVGRTPKLSYIVPECNSLGVMLMGGGSSEEVIASNKTQADTVVILERDLYELAPRSSVDSFLSRIRNVIVLDCLPSETASKARLLLPSATFAEGDGTLVNNEGRAQRFYRVFPPSGDVRDSWRWIIDMLKAAGKTDAAAWETIDDIGNAMANSLPLFRALADIAPSADFRISGMKIPRQPHRYSGRTAMHADISVHEPKPTDDFDSPLAFSMEGYENMPPPSLVTRYWVPGWNSVQALSKFQGEIGDPLRGGDPGIRLIGPRENAVTEYFKKVHKQAVHKAKDWTVVPLYHIYGSEKWSMLSRAIAELAPHPYLALNVEALEHQKIAEGDIIVLIGRTVRLELPVRCMDSLPKGVAGLPFGLSGMKLFDYSERYSIETAVHRNSP
ncbi:MAG: NADH-quinone oxidoreductase subunit NuoG [Dissulfurispiraceae bacterium]